MSSCSVAPAQFCFGFFQILVTGNLFSGKNVDPESVELVWTIQVGALRTTMILEQSRKLIVTHRTNSEIRRHDPTVKCCPTSAIHLIENNR